MRHMERGWPHLTGVETPCSASHFSLPEVEQLYFIFLKVCFKSHPPWLPLSPMGEGHEGSDELSRSEHHSRGTGEEPGRLLSYVLGSRSGGRRAGERSGGVCACSSCAEQSCICSRVFLRGQILLLTHEDHLWSKCALTVFHCPCMHMILCL